MVLAPQYRFAWLGWTRRVDGVIAVLLILAAISWGFGITWFVQTMNTPSYDLPPPPPGTQPTGSSDAELFFFSNAVPMACTIASAVELVLFLMGRLHPMASIIWAWVSTLIWAAMLGMWYQCRFESGCVVDPTPRFGGPYEARGVSGWLADARVGLAGALFGLNLLVYMPFAIVANEKRKAAAKGEVIRLQDQ